MKIYSELRIKKEFGMNGEGEDFADSTDSAGEINGQETNGQNTNGQNASGQETDGQETSEAEYDAAKLEIIDATKSGFVRSVNVFGKVVSGETFAEVLSLDTTNFHIDKVEEGYRIISIGKGNSIGMSVYAVRLIRRNRAVHTTKLFLTIIRKQYFRTAYPIKKDSIHFFHFVYIS